MDTGSSRSLISWASLKALSPRVSRLQLQPCNVLLKDYQGSQIPTLGCSTFHVVYGTFSGRLPLIVVKHDRPSLIGLDWFSALHLSISGIHTTVPASLSSILMEFADVFDGQLGKYKGLPISFNLDSQVAPVRLKPRRVPLALRPRVDKELDNLLARGSSNRWSIQSGKPLLSFH